MNAHNASTSHTAPSAKLCIACHSQTTPALTLVMLDTSHIMACVQDATPAVLCVCKILISAQDVKVGTILYLGR
jgi:hypothetical protein